MSENCTDLCRTECRDSAQYGAMPTIPKEHMFMYQAHSAFAEHALRYGRSENSAAWEYLAEDLLDSTKLSSDEKQSYPDS